MKSIDVISSLYKVEDGFRLSSCINYKWIRVEETSRKQDNNQSILHKPQGMCGAETK